MRVTVQKIRHRRWSCGQHCCSVKKLSEKKQVEIKRLQANLEVLQRTSLAATHDSEVPKLNPLVSSSDDRQNISQPLTPQCMVDCTLCDPVCNTKPLLAECLLWTVKWFSIKNWYGIISHSDTQEDIFVHRRAIMPKKLKIRVRRAVHRESVQFHGVVSEKGIEGSNGQCSKTRWQLTSKTFICHWQSLRKRTLISLPQQVFTCHQCSIYAKARSHEHDCSQVLATFVTAAEIGMFAEHFLDQNNYRSSSGIHWYWG